MIASLRGRVAHKSAEGVVIECGGVGYGVAMSLSALARLGEGDEIQVLVHTHVGQDVLKLFGFLEAAEQHAFQVLIGIAGVGPKLALAVLSTFSAGELADTVGRGDASALVRIPGVGKKKAERLLLELKDRLPAVLVMPSQAAGRANFEDLVSALVNLGFSAQVAEKAARQALDDHPGEADVATLVREALRATTRR